jgi:lipopolysaccharide biosynthesis protein
MGRATLFVEKYVSLKLIAFYLPQYHPIPENDRWWGEGFTDWVNVKRGVPCFTDHYQPHEPAELGYYDLRDPSVAEAQAALARAYGIHAFCYYHYWFNGKLLLQYPVEKMLSSQKPDFPFCICWANENWTRAWDGKDKEILIGQEYTAADHEAHCRWLLPVFKDKRYVKINGRPLFLIYRTDHIPELQNTVRLWKTVVRSAGFPDLFLCAMRSNFPKYSGKELIEVGFDAIVDFQPNVREFPRTAFIKKLPKKCAAQFYKILAYITKRPLARHRYFSSRILSYTKQAESVLQDNHAPPYRMFSCVFPSWDNSARKTDATVLQNLSPAAYGRWLRQTSERTLQRLEAEERLVFINAWNEWAEGCHLEPDKRFGRAFLEETLKAYQELKEMENGEKTYKGEKNY